MVLYIGGFGGVVFVDFLGFLGECWGLRDNVFVVLCGFNHLGVLFVGFLPIFSV